MPELDWSSLPRPEYLALRLRETIGAVHAARSDGNETAARGLEELSTKLRRELDDARGAAASDEERTARLTALDPRDVARRVAALAPHLARLAPAEARTAAEAILAALPREPAAIAPHGDPVQADVSAES